MGGVACTVVGIGMYESLHWASHCLNEKTATKLVLCNYAEPENGEYGGEDVVNSNRDCWWHRAYMQWVVSCSPMLDIGQSTDMQWWHALGMRWGGR